MARPFYHFEAEDPGYDALANWLICHDPEWLETCAESGQLFFIRAAEVDELVLGVEEVIKAVK